MKPTVIKEKTAPAVVVVADDRAAFELRGAYGEAAVVQVDNYLMALGEMSRRKVTAVVGRIDPAAATLESTARSLRELAPAAKLLLLVAANQQAIARRAVRLGFDDYLIEPIGEGQLVASLNGKRPQMLEPELDSAVSSAVEPLAEQAAWKDQSDPQPLGDVDLVEQVLYQRGDMIDLALRIVREQPGGADLEWSQQPVDDGRPCRSIEFGGQVFGYLTSARCDPQTLAGYAAWLGRWLLLDRQFGRLNELVWRDELTGVWNRRYFDRLLASLLDRAKAERFRVTLMVYDIDDFKHYNDTYGHQAGDEVLRSVAKMMQSVLRKHDIVARIGGDEFAVIFWDAEPPRRAHSEHPKSVRSIVERYKRAICAHRFPALAEVREPLTISGGLAGYPWDGLTPDALMHAADHMLLESKRQGKNALTFGPGACINHPADEYPPTDPA